jgi:hypothetical protein
VSSPQPLLKRLHPGVGLRGAAGRTTSHRAIRRQKHRGHTWPLPSVPQRHRLAMGCVCRCRRFRGRGPEGACSRGERSHPAAAIGAQAAAGRSGAAQGGDGNLVCLFLRYAVAGHRTALRYPLQQHLWTIRSLDPARPLASVARPAAPHLAARLRRYPRTQRRGHRQSLLPLGAELF